MTIAWASFTKRWERPLALLRLIVTTGCLTGLFFLIGLTPTELLHLVGEIKLPYLWCTLAILSALMFALVLKWYLIARALNIRVPFRSAWRLYLVGSVLNNVLPTAIGGDMYRVYFLSRESDAGLRRSLLSVAIERATGYGGLLALSAPAAVFYFVGWQAGVAVALALVTFALAVYVFLRRIGRSRRPAGGGVISGWLGLSPSLICCFTAFSVFQQGLWVSTAAILGLAYGLSVPWSYWVLAVTALTLLTVLPISLGGLGVREAGYVALLSPLGVEASRATAVGFAMGFAPSLVSLLWLLPVLVSDYRNQPKRVPLVDVGVSAKR